MIMRKSKAAKEKLLHAEGLGDFDFALVIKDRGTATDFGPVVDVQIDAHRPGWASAAVLFGADVRTELAHALALLFARPQSSVLRVDMTDGTLATPECAAGGGI
jgi:hypothetical protein